MIFLILETLEKDESPSFALEVSREFKSFWTGLLANT